MALEAQFDAGFGPVSRYLRIRSYHLDRDSGAITQGKLEIFRDQQTRAAHKRAVAEIAALDVTIAMKEAAFRQADADFKALPEAERAAALQAHGADRRERADAIAVMKQRRIEQVNVREANKAGKVVEFDVQPGEVQIGPDGEVLTALYALFASRIPDAQEV